ncbi:CYFA0S05e04456g1_1 [Cyberlindnera fabianii]|uniref:CYFA0S05e04456g1_1 n=1 Tax=Cyberlindnera fabianii TaxID=36022 RepID=A0A061AT13_CYBFA|nr:CYFA0S05e04456g1_1 [Cyberlindnera fabianii]
MRTTSRSKIPSRQSGRKLGQKPTTTSTKERVSIANTAPSTGNNMSKDIGPLSKRLRPLYDQIFQLKDTVSDELIYEIFNVVPDKKLYPDYYDFIRAPTSLNSIKKRISNYATANEFIKDLAQIVWNAKTYNEQGSFVYRFAEILDKYITGTVIPKLKKQGYDVGYPDLSPISDGIAGPLVAYDSNPLPQDTSSQAQSLRSTPGRDIDDDGFNSDDDTSMMSTKKRIHSSRDRGGDQSFKRGRPPVIDKPFEQRIKNVLRNLKKEKDGHGNPLTMMFDRLPDSRDYPDYYKAISQPISLDEIRKKIKQRKYKDVDGFVIDMNTMIGNAKYYNDENSDVFRTTLLLESWFKKFLEIELKKPDTDFISSDDLKIPLEQLELHGKLYKIGDWILINNPNDPHKPIVAQLFRIWQTQDGQRWINVCWYLRAEQTVHRVDRLFYENEVFKSGQYRDHLADEIIGKCYVAYFTRYQRGDPAVPYEGPLFICEYRYNDNDKNFNKIRTWRACLPDEVRDFEDPITPLPQMRMFKKYESPLKHLLPPNASFNMPIPEPTIGAPNAPPLHGAVYLRDIDETDDLGQYSTSRQCPKYIIRPNDPTPGQGVTTSSQTPSLANYTRNVTTSQIQNTNVYHAAPTYVPSFGGSTFTIPLQLKTAISGVTKMEASANGKRRNVGGNVKDGQVIWFRAPGIKVLNRVVNSIADEERGVQTVSAITGANGEDRVDEIKKDLPGNGMAGIVGLGHSAKYMAWKRQKLENATK